MRRAALRRFAIAPRWRKVLRDVWQHKPRTVLVVLAIAVGILGAGAVLDTWVLVRDAVRGEYRASNPASATLDVDAIDAALLAHVGAMPAVADVQSRTTASTSARAQEGWRPALLFACADFGAVRIGVVEPQTGAWPPRAGEIVIEASSLAFAGIAVGDSLLVQVGDAAPHRLPVVGVARDVGLAPGWMEHVVYGFVTPSTLAQIGLRGREQLQLVVADKTLDRDGVRRIAHDIRDAVAARGHAVGNVDIPVPGRHIHAAQMDSLLFTQGAFGILALISSGILVVNLIAAMLAGQVREIAVMKALGAHSGDVASLYLGVAFVLGLVACAIAIPAAAVAGRKYAEFTAGLLNFDVTGFSIPRRVFALQVAVGALLPVAAAAIPVLRGTRIPVAQALRDFGIDAASAATSGRWLRHAGRVPRPVLLALRNTSHRRQRLVLTLSTLAMGGAVYVGALDLQAAIRGSVDLLFAANRFDIILRFARPAPSDSLEAAVAAVAGVAHSEAWGATRAAFRDADGRLGDTFPISAPPASTRLFVPRFHSGRWPAPAEGNALVVNRRLVADHPQLVFGDTLTLLIAGVPRLWRVAGIVDTGPSPAAYTCREVLVAAGGRATMDRVVVAAASSGPATQLELVQRLRAELGGRGFSVQSSQLMQPARRVMEDHLLMVAGFLRIMAQLMIVVGGLGLAATMSLSVLERRREIGVLRAIGARHRAILEMVLIEGLVVGIASWLLALPLSIPMSVILGWAFGRIMLPVPVLLVPQFAAAVQWLGVVTVVSVAASLWPAWRATRIPTRAALVYE